MGRNTLIFVMQIEKLYILYKINEMIMVKKIRVWVELSGGDIAKVPE